MSDLNEFLQPKDSPISDPGGTAPWKLGVTQNIQQNRIRMSQANIKNFVLFSTVATASGAIGNGTTLAVQTRLTPNAPRQFDPNFAQVNVSIYQGTAASGTGQIYPSYGSGITPGAYTVQGDYDYQGYTGAGTNSAWTVWSGNITDNNAGNQTIYFVSEWRYLQYNSGTVS